MSTSAVSATNSVPPSYLAYNAPAVYLSTGVGHNNVETASLVAQHQNLERVRDNNRGFNASTQFHETFAPIVHFAERVISGAETFLHNMIKPPANFVSPIGG
jgi:hypothetical protein